MHLITILGDDNAQLVPVIHGLRTMADRHTLVCDTQTQDQARRLKNGMETFAREHGFAWRITIRTVDPDDQRGSTRRIIELIDDPANTTLNATMAYPMLTLLLSEHLRPHGGTILSYDHDTNLLHTLRRDDAPTCAPVPGMGIRDYVTLLGYRITAAQTRSDLLPRRDQLTRLCRETERFRALRYALLYPEKNRRFSFKPYGDLLSILRRLKIVRGHRLIPSAQKTLGGDLFEEYVFWLVESLGFDEVLQGVKVDFDTHSDEPLHQHRVFNEFDLIMIHNNRLCTIECKYATRLDGLKIVYKYDAIIDYFGLASRALILNISSRPKEPYHDMNTSANFRHSTLRRAHRAHIHIHHVDRLDPQTFREVVEEFFEIGE
jgi:hypothetical protein